MIFMFLGCLRLSVYSQALRGPWKLCHLLYQEEVLDRLRMASQCLFYPLREHSASHYRGSISHGKYTQTDKE